jgi:hypothetical protein
MKIAKFLLKKILHIQKKNSSKINVSQKKENISTKNYIPEVQPFSISLSPPPPFPKKE